MAKILFEDEESGLIGFYPGNYEATYPLEIYDGSVEESNLIVILRVSISAILIDKVLDENNVMQWLWGLGLTYIGENQPEESKVIIIREKDVEEGNLITPFEELEEKIEEDEE